MRRARECATVDLKDFGRLHYRTFVASCRHPKPDALTSRLEGGHAHLAFPRAGALVYPSAPEEFSRPNSSATYAPAPRRFVIGPSAIAGCRTTALVCRCHAGRVLFQQKALNNGYGMPHKR